MQMTRSWQHPASGSLARDAVFDKLFASSIRFGSMNLIGPQSKSLKHFLTLQKHVLAACNNENKLKPFNAKITCTRFRQDEKAPRSASGCEIHLRIFCCLIILAFVVLLNSDRDRGDRVAIYVTVVAFGLLDPPQIWKIGKCQQSQRS